MLRRLLLLCGILLFPNDFAKKVTTDDCKMADVLELDTVEEFEDGAGNDREVAVVEAMDDGAAGGEDLSALKDKGELRF